MHPPLPMKGDLGIAKNYRGITLTSIAANIYNALRRNHIELKIEKILRKNKNGFRTNRFTSQIFVIRLILGVWAKKKKNKLDTMILFVEFSIVFEFLNKWKIEQIILAYGLPKETVAAIMMLYKNTKVKVLTSDGDTDYFDILAFVLKRDTWVPYLFIICLDYELRRSIDKMKDKIFKLTKERNRICPAQRITDADYADDIVLLANTSARAETLLHSLERAAAGIYLHVYAHKTECMWFN